MHYPLLTYRVSKASQVTVILNILVDHLPPSQLSLNFSSADLLHIIFIDDQRKFWVTMIYKVNHFWFFSLVLQKIQKNEFHYTEILESIGVELNLYSLALASQLLQLIQRYFLYKKKSFYNGVFRSPPLPRYKECFNRWREGTISKVLAIEELAAKFDL